MLVDPDSSKTTTPALLGNGFRNVYVPLHILMQAARATAKFRVGIYVGRPTSQKQPVPDTSGVGKVEGVAVVTLVVTLTWVVTLTSVVTVTLVETLVLTLVEMLVLTLVETLVLTLVEMLTSVVTVTLIEVTVDAGHALVLSRVLARPKQSAWIDVRQEAAAGTADFRRRGWHSSHPRR